MGKKFTKDYQPQKKWTEEKAIQLGEDLVEWLTEKDEDNEDKGNMFIDEYIVIERGYYPDLVAYLAKKYNSFSDLIKKAKKIQETKLVKYGVQDRLNAAMTKFVLINNHNWKSEKHVEINHTGKLTGIDIEIIRNEKKD
jgi:hypothetical protein